MRMPSRPVAAGLVLGLLLAVVLSVALPVWAGRNSSGTYTLPPGNPVTPGTPISSTWANTTLSDIATGLTDSLDRQGRGSMAAPLVLQVGGPSAPSLTFLGDTDTGLYHPAADTAAMTAAGVLRQQWTATGTSVTGTLAATGDVTAPNITATGTLASSGNATIAGNLAVDVATLVVDGAANRVGIGDPTPETTFDVEMSAPAAPLAQLRNTSATGFANIDFISSDDVQRLAFGFANASAASFPGNAVALLNGADMVFAYGGAQRLRIGSTGTIIGSAGTAISTSIGGTFTFNFGSMVAGECLQQSFTLAGAVLGSVCTVSMNITGSSSPAYSVRCHATGGIVSILLCNGTPVTQDPPSADFYVRAWVP